MASNVWKLYLYQLFLNLGFWWPIWVIYLQEELGLGLAEIGLLEVPFWLTMIALQIPVAAMADRFGRKPVLALGALTLAVAVALFGLARGLGLVLASYLFWGASLTMTIGPASAFLYDSLYSIGRQEEYRRLAGVSYAVVMGAALVAMLSGAPMAAALGLRFPIFLSAGTAALALVLSLTFREPTLALRSERPPSLLRVAREGLALAARRPTVRYAVLFYGVPSLASVAPIIYAQPFLVEHGVSLGQVGAWQAPLRLAGAMGALSAPAWGRALGSRVALKGLAAAAMASYGLLALWDSLAAGVAFLALNFAFAASQPLLTDYLHRRLPTEQRATVVSLTTLVYAAVMMSAAVGVGRVADAMSLRAAFALLALLAMAPGLALSLLWHRADAQEAVTAGPQRVATVG